MEFDCRTPTEHVQRGSAEITSFLMSRTHLISCRHLHPAEEPRLHDATLQWVHITVPWGGLWVGLCCPWPHLSGPLSPAAHCVGEGRTGEESFS